MLLYIEIKSRTKDELDRLVELGQHRDYSEAISVAIANQLLLERQAAERAETDPARLQAPKTESGAAEARKVSPEKTNLEVPALFSVGSASSKPAEFAQYPNETLAPGQEVTVDRWIFGQHNKLLPVKATCRALARMMSEATTNLAVGKVAVEIASEAVTLGDYLRRIDETSGVHRDDALSFAFPSSESDNNDKSRLRYGNQFVASVTPQGALTGLPVELKLVNADQSRTPHLLLTEAGWEFAVMRNPVLDDGKDGRQSRFSAEEIDYLVAHIRSHVPAEAFAYKAVLEAITLGAKTPDKLDDALNQFLPERKEKPFSRAFLTTQRAGVVSRMVDLGLLQRIRDGIKVSYAATEKSFEFLSNPLAPGRVNHER